MRVVLIGAGGMGRLHAGNLTSIDGVKVTAVCDERPDAADALAATCGARAYRSVPDLLAAETPDAAYVCLPPSAHGPTELALAAAGVPFFVEKPVALHPDTARRVADAVDAAGIVASVGYHWRYLETTAWAQQALEGVRVLLAAGWWLGTTPQVSWWRHAAESGGQVVEQATHVVDLARYLLGEVSVMCGSQADLVISARYPDADIADVNLALLRFASGALGTLATTCSLDHGSTVGLDIFTDSVILHVRGDTLVEDRCGAVLTRKATTRAFQLEDETFVRALQTGDPRAVRSTYRDAVDTLAVTHAILDAARNDAR